jgi:ATP-dependent Clp protease ATP-binding subunit ClpC
MKKTNTKSKTPFLDEFTTDITAQAIEGKLDPVVGRESEMKRLAQVLSRRKKNNPVLIGKAGVGKSSVVALLAQKIIKRDVPDTLFNKKVLALDMATLVAGTKYRGDFEERMKKIIEELKKSTDVILFIDEIHTLMGAGSTSGSLDAANILKPALARGEISCIGATTLDEYRKIEKDPALDRRFQKIIVNESTLDETRSILNNIKSRYEEFHNVTYTSESIEACLKLSERYMSDRCFPDKAIDALDEAGSAVRINSEPPQILLDLNKKT